MIISNRSDWEFSQISRTRGILVGLSTILILCFHAQINFDILVAYGGLIKNIGMILCQIKNIANVGVDMFLFLSGFGLYYSINKNPSIKNFYKSRIVKVIIPAMIGSAVFSLLTTYNPTDFWLRFSLLSFYIDGDRFLWYIALLIILYLVFPLINIFLKSNSNKGIIILLLSVIIFNFIVYFAAGSYYSKIEIALTRIPIFIIGALTGKLSKANKSISSKRLKTTYFITPVIIVLAVVLNYFLSNTNLYFFVRYLYIALTLCLIIVFSDISSRINADSVKRVISFIGKYSLELYICYTDLLFWFKKPLNFLCFSSIIYCFAVFLINLLIGILFKCVYHAIEKYITLLFRKIKKQPYSV